MRLGAPVYIWERLRGIPDIDVWSNPCVIVGDSLSDSLVETER